MISILVAYTKNNRIIGSEGKIPWNLPSERNRFKQISSNKYIIMGRKSFEEIGHSLPYCTIVIISKTLQKAPEGCILASSLKQGIAICKEKTKNEKTSEILIAGGGEIYKQILPYTTRIYATEIYEDIKGDVTFPLLPGNWNCTEEEIKKENNILYKYVTYNKITK